MADFGGQNWRCALGTWVPKRVENGCFLGWVFGGPGTGNGLPGEYGQCPGAKTDRAGPPGVFMSDLSLCMPCVACLPGALRGFMGGFGGLSGH